MNLALSITATFIMTLGYVLIAIWGREDIMSKQSWNGLGQALVEMTLFMPLLLLILVGLLEIGWAIRGYLVLSQITREVARYGARQDVKLLDYGRIYDHFLEVNTLEGVPELELYFYRVFVENPCSDEASISKIGEFSNTGELNLIDETVIQQQIIEGEINFVCTKANREGEDWVAGYHDIIVAASLYRQKGMVFWYEIPLKTYTVMRKL